MPGLLRVDGFDEPVWLLFVDIGPRAGVNLVGFEDMFKTFAAARSAAA